MSSGQYCLIRDLGPVKGGKGLRHHEVLLDLSWRGLVRFLKSMPRLIRPKEPSPPPDGLMFVSGRTKFAKQLRGCDPGHADQLGRRLPRGQQTQFVSFESSQPITDGV